MSKATGKELLTTLEQMGMIEYGSVIPADMVRKILGIEYPQVATKIEFDRLSLSELSGVDYVRNVLLGRGMYLSQSNGNYRILLPSENAKQVELYIGSADKKLNRALKLTRNTPQTDMPSHHDRQLEARIVMKKLGARRSFN